VIDFKNGSFFKLHPSNSGGELVAPILIPGENVVMSFKSLRDIVVFTDKRIITVNVQGVTGKKKDFSSLSYAKIQAFSVETAGTFDLDSELELYFSGLGKVKLEFVGNINISSLCRFISMYVLR
jgi:hypothetical protein